MSTFNELWHLAIEESQEQGANVRAVHIGIGHDDDAVIAQLLRLVFILANTGAQSSNQRDDFLRRNQFVKACFFDVENFALEWQDRLKFAIASLFC